MQLNIYVLITHLTIKSHKLANKKSKNGLDNLILRKSTSNLKTAKIIRSRRHLKAKRKSIWSKATSKKSFANRWGLNFLKYKCLIMMGESFFECIGFIVFYSILFVAILYHYDADSPHTQKPSRIVIAVIGIVFFMIYLFLKLYMIHWIYSVIWFVLLFIVLITYLFGFADLIHKPSKVMHTTLK